MTAPHLTALELCVYRFIDTHPGCTEDEIFAAIYSIKARVPTANIIGVTISRLRKKIPGIEIVRSSVYRIVKDPQE